MNAWKGLNKRFLLIVLPYMVEKAESPSSKWKSWATIPYGALSIATYVESLTEVMIVDCNVVDGRLTDPLFVHLDRVMTSFKPTLVGISMTFDMSYPYLKEVLWRIEKVDPGVLVIMGGAATWASYKEILDDNPFVDAICYGEGEIPVRDLLVVNSPKLLLTSPSWITQSSMMLKQVPVKAPLKSLDSAIKLNYDMIDIEKYSLRDFSPDNKSYKKLYPLITSRGCPYGCAFCYRSIDRDKTMRFASVDKVIETVKYLVNEHGMDHLSLWDDQLIINKNRAKELFLRLKPFNLRIEISQGISVDFLDEELAMVMRDAGVVRATLPIESGSKEMLEKMVEKPIDLEKAKETIKMLRKYGFWINTLFVCGFPGETEKHRQETIDWIKEADPDWSTFSAATPIRGTKLYNMCIENGWIPKQKLGEMDVKNYIIEIPGYPAKDVDRTIYKMNLECNFVNNRAQRLGNHKEAVKIFGWVTDSYPDHAFAWYYLSRSLFWIKEARKAFDMFSDILLKDSEWKKYASDFGLNSDFSDFGPEEIWKNYIA